MPAPVLLRKNLNAVAETLKARGYELYASRWQVLEDTLGQSTEIQFTEGERNIEVQPQWFSFVPPEGVDVLEG